MLQSFLLKFMSHGAKCRVALHDVTFFSKYLPLVLLETTNRGTGYVALNGKVVSDAMMSWKFLKVFPEYYRNSSRLMLKIR